MRLDSTDNPALQQLERAYPEVAELLRRLKTLDAARVPTSKTVPLPLPSHWQTVESDFATRHRH